jgi:hypothetical protein
MSELERLSRPPVDPIYAQETPNQEIDLGTASLRISDNSKSTETTAKVRLSFAPDSDLEFVCPIGDGLPPFGVGLLDRLNLTLTDCGIAFDALLHSTNAERSEIVYIPTTSGVLVSKPSNTITSAVFHLFNFPELICPDDYHLTRGTPPYQSWQRCGRCILRADGWTITIATTNLTGELVKLLKKQGGFVITHVGRVVRDDGSSFSSEELSDLLACLHYFLSFALGRWAGLSLPIGFDAAGGRVFEEWGTRMTAGGAWNGPYSCLDEHHGELLSQVFPGFFALWKNPVWRTPLAHTLYWYLGSCGRGTGIGVDTGIILAQTALKLLAWTHCVIDRKLAPRAQFKRGGLSAAERLRKLASSLSIPLDIPTGISVLPRKSGAPWTDSMALITGIRNALVHPDKGTALPDQPFYEGWKLSLWYLDMTLLRLCGHDGNYANRLRQRYVGEVDPVPWAKVT